ncbi:MAG: DegV family protein [Eubacterium sp.]|nr:DegV family protein [Eubacterium sp.]
MASVRDIIITADSTCDLPPEIVQDRDITIIPLSILLGENEYLDGVDVTPQDIYSFVEKTDVLPKTAAVPPSRYYDVFESAVREGKKVVHIGLSSAISSSYQNACVAASDFDDVYVVDSKSLCTAMGLLVLKACDFRDKGMDAKKIADKVTKLVPKLSATFVLNSLEYLHKGGRCSGVARFGANVLGIKPSIAVDENGAMDIAKKYRGKMDAVYKQYVSDCINDAGKIDTSRIVIATSGGIDTSVMAFVRGLIEGFGKFDEVIFADAGCTISSHCGPKTLAVFYIKK